jgi:hypothetical protein
MIPPIEEIERRAVAGDANAQRLLVSLLRERAASGNVAANRALGQVLLTRPPYEIAEGVAATLFAADAGDAAGAHLAAILLGSGIGRAQDWATALRYLQRASANGHGIDQAVLAMLSAEAEWNGLPYQSSMGMPPGPLRPLASSAVLAEWLQVPTVDWRFAAPRLGIVNGFIQPHVCDWLVARARPHIAPAVTIDSRLGAPRIDDIRTNGAMNFGLVNSDLLVVLIRARIAAVLRRTITELEPTAILHYASGEQYGSHFDFLDPASPGCARQIAEGGQRIATCLVYLNDDYSGGETAFPAVGFSYKGRKGDALLFWNVDREGGPDKQTLHTGLPPTQGEKWVLSQWIRDREGALFGPILPS